jgi:hypothetical protein
VERETARWRCIGDDESPVMVIEYRHTPATLLGQPVRAYPGARRLALPTGEPVRYIDATTFEVMGTGELLRRTN